MKQHIRLKFCIFAGIAFILAILSNHFKFSGITKHYAIKKEVYIILSEIVHMNKTSALRLIILTVFFMFIFLHLLYEIKVLYGWLYKYRYWIGIAIVLFCVIFEISGSSINIWSKYIGGTGINIFGTSKSIRYDEWNTNTPMAFSQFYNKSGQFSYFASTFRGTKTDMFIVYGQPVKYWAVIFRPFHWGYLLWGTEKGLAFFWSARLVALYLVTFELFMLLTNKKKVISGIFALLVTFSPIVQWWFAVNGLVEMLIWGQLAVILTDLFMKSEDVKKKILYSFAFIIATGGYILTFYPAWQVPLAYVFVALFIYIIIRNKNDYKFTAQNFKILIVTFIILIVSLGSIFIKSLDTIKLVLNTAYPGKRIAMGGDLNMFFSLFRYPGSIFYPFRTANLPTNTCEMAEFIDFFPLGILLTVFILFIKKYKDKLLQLLLGLQIFFLMWILFPWPAWLSKFTLLSMSPPFRTMIALGFINILMTARAMAYLIDEKIKIKYSYLISIIAGGILIMNSVYAHEAYLTHKRILIILILFIFCFYVILNCQLKKNTYAFALVCVLLTFYAGICVNPMESGADVIYKNEMVQTIKKINDTNPGIWIVEGAGGSAFNNLPVLVGASTLNSTNTYPNLEAWRKVDTSLKYTDIYNRYAHVVIQLNKNGNNSFELLIPDHFKLNLDVNKLKDFNIKYIFATRNLSSLNSKETVFERIYQYNNCYIFKVKYIK